eukprot:304174-Prymnesium_polylepis.1
MLSDHRQRAGPRRRQQRRARAFGRCRTAARGPAEVKRRAHGRHRPVQAARTVEHVERRVAQLDDHVRPESQKACGSAARRCWRSGGRNGREDRHRAALQEQQQAAQKQQRERCQLGSAHGHVFGVCESIYSGVQYLGYS